MGENDTPAAPTAGATPPAVTPSADNNGNPPAGTTPPAGTPPPINTPSVDNNGNPPAGTTPPAGTSPANPPAGTTPPAGTPPTENKWWRDTITDPKQVNVAERIASPADAIQSIIDLRTQLSERIKVPDANASEEDVAKYRKALGIPDKPEDYDVSAPEGVEMTDLDKAVVDRLMPIAHKSNVPKAAFQSFVNEMLNFQVEVRNNLEQRIQSFAQEAEQNLRREYGQDFEPNLAVANRVVSLGGDSFKDFLNKTQLPGGGLLGDHPEMIRFFTTIGRRSAEGELALGNSPQERQTFQQELDDLNKKVPVGSPGYTAPEHQKKLQELYSKIHGSAPIVGGSARVA